MVRILQERLQQVAEAELPESQCGFRKGRGCSDMTFSLRQLVEKSVEHRSKQFITFVDFKRAYDSVPRTALWRALAKLGIPENIINLVKSFHDGMRAQLSIYGELLEDRINVDNGPRRVYNGPNPLQPLCLSGGGEMDSTGGRVGWCRD